MFLGSEVLYGGFFVRGVTVFFPTTYRGLPSLFLGVQVYLYRGPYNFYRVLRHFYVSLLFRDQGGVIASPISYVIV